MNTLGEGGLLLAVDAAGNDLALTANHKFDFYVLEEGVAPAREYDAGFEALRPLAHHFVDLLGFQCAGIVAGAIHIQDSGGTENRLAAGLSIAHSLLGPYRTRKNDGE